MREDIQFKLEALKFTPNSSGGMTARMEDVQFTAVEHPIKGLAFIVEHVGARSATLFETFVPLDASLQEIVQVMVQAFEQVHPERK